MDRIGTRNRYRDIAEAGIGYLSSHVTIVGAWDDSRTAALYRTALASIKPKRRQPQWKAPSSQKLPLSCTNRLRASQIAASMLVDFETVDIR